MELWLGARSGCSHFESIFFKSKIFSSSRLKMRIENWPIKKSHFELNDYRIKMRIVKLTFKNFSCYVKNILTNQLTNYVIVINKFIKYTSAMISKS